MRNNIILSLILLAFHFSHAQQALTFSDCLEKAISNNLRLKNAEVDEKIAVYQRTASYGKLLPNINAVGENRNSWGREIDSHTNLYVNNDLKTYEGTLNATFNLFSGFTTINTIKAAKQEVDINKTNVERVKMEITIDVAQRFITILYLQEIISANREQIAASEKQLEIANLKFNSGVIAESEVFKIKSQKAIEELNLLTNQNLLVDNLVTLKQLMNLPIEQEIVLLEPDLKLDPNALLEQDQYALTRKAVEIHPAYQMSLLETKQARTELSLARAGFYPTLSMRLLYRSNYADNYPEIPFNSQLDENTNKGIRFLLTIPIFSQGDNYARAKTSKMKYKQSKILAEIEENRLSKEVLQAITDTRTSAKKNEASTIAFDFSQKSYDADLLKFEAGRININELNTTKLNYNRAQADLIQSKYQLLFNNALIKFYAGEPFTL